MPYELFLALRYLRTRRGRRGAAQLTALAATSGIACGVAALTLAMALANGFRDELQDKILRGTAHLTLSSTTARPAADWRAVVERVRRVEGVVDASPTAYTGALLNGPDGAAYTVLRGVDADSPRVQAEVRRTLLEGRVEDLFLDATTPEQHPREDVSGEALGLPFGELTDEEPPAQAIIGVELAKRTGLVRVGDEGWIVVGERIAEPPGLAPRARRIRVAGLFRSGLYDYDASWSYVSLAVAEGFDGLAAGDAGTSNTTPSATGREAARTTASAKGSATGKTTGSAAANVSDSAAASMRGSAAQRAVGASVISVEVSDIYASGRVAQRVGEVLGAGWTIVDWREANRPLFAALELERRTVALIIGLIMIVAALNITATLVLVVFERRGDIAILSAMGASARSIMAVFMLEGALIGALGACLGVALGLSACLLANHFGLVRLPSDVYSLSAVPLHPHARDVALVALSAFAVSLLATLYPARAAARVRPAEALRYE